MLLEIVAGALIAAGVLASTSGGFARKRALRAVHATPKLSTSSSVGADVIAIGRVRLLGPELDAPLSGRPCVAYRARVYRRSVDGVYWERAGITPFRLEREDGTAVIVEATHVLFLFPPLPLPVDARCDELAIELGLSAGIRKHGTYEEVLVLEDMRIAVRGRLDANGDTPRLGGDPARPLIIAVPF